MPLRLTSFRRISSPESGLAARTSWVSAATLASRVMGFARDAATAALLGVGPVADALTAALALPLLARRLLAEGAFNLAFIPALARAEREGEAAARALALTLLVLMGGLLLALAGVAIVLMPGLIRLLAPGFVPEGDRAAVAILCGRVAVLYLPLAGLSALYGGIANAAHRVVLAALAPFAANLTVLSVIFVLLIQGELGSDTAAQGIAGATVAAGVSQWLLMRRAARGCPAVPRLCAGGIAALPWRGGLAVLRAASPVLLFAGLSQFRLMIAAATASGSEGAVAALNYAQRLIDLPLGLVGASAGAILVPLLVRRAAQGQAAGAAATGALVTALAFALPAAAGLAVLAHPIVVVLFQRGAFDSQDAELTARLLMILALALPAQGLERVLSATAAAVGLVRGAERIALGSLALCLLAAAAGVALAGPPGAALGVVASAYGSLAVLVAVLARRRALALDGRAFAAMAGLAAAAGLMGGAVAGAAHLWPVAEGAAGALRLAALVGLGVAVYGVVALGLKRHLSRQPG